MFRTTEFIKKYPFKVENSFILLKLTDEKPEIIEKLHQIECRYDGICMEGLMAWFYGINNEFLVDRLVLNDCLSFLIELMGNHFSEKHKEIRQIDLLTKSFKIEMDLLRRIFLVNLSNPFLILSNYENSILFYVCGYLLNHLTKNNERLDFQKFRDYFSLLSENIESISEYIKNVQNSLRARNVKFGIGISLVKNGIEIIGEADMTEDDWLFDIKCSRETPENIDSWHRQLEVYNEFICKNNIAIINLLNNHLIIFGTRHEFHSFVPGQTEFDDLLDESKK